jgi:hypothetical protein
MWEEPNAKITRRYRISARHKGGNRRRLILLLQAARLGTLLGSHWAAKGAAVIIRQGILY